MRIAVDVRELCGRPTGVGRYLTGLLRAWADSADALRHEWRLYAHAPATLPEKWQRHLHVVDGAGGSAWEQLTLSRSVNAQRPDVFFAPGYTAPLSVSAPLVLTIHDVSFFAHREWFTFREGARRRTLTAWSARRARKVITDSQFSKQQIGAHIGIPDSRVSVIPLGIDRPGPPNRDSGSRREPMVLFAGSIFARRRVDQLIAAFDLLAARVPAATLQIVGENRTRNPRLDLEHLKARCRHGDRIHLRSYVDDAALAALYGQASVFVFLSEYEGFGFTPLEALAAGVAPVLLDTAIARETCGPAARYVAPDAPLADVAEVIFEVLTSDTARDELLSHAASVLDRFDWRLTAAATLRVLEEAALGR